MLLAIDIGNTNIHMGLWQSGTWTLSWRARSVAEKMPDEYAVLIHSFLTDADMGWKAVTGVIIGSVVPTLTVKFSELIDRYTQLTPILVTHEINTGVKISVDQPQQAGADRIANAAAANALYGGPAIVIDFGTSTNFDVVSGKGEYLGGAIAPGIHLAHDALVSRAAKLHKVDVLPPPSAIGRNTIHAMQSGLFWGHVAAVEGIAKRLVKALNEDKVTILATGGFAPMFQKHTDVIDIIAPQLTLDGLRVIYDLNNT